MMFAPSHEIDPAQVKVIQAKLEVWIASWLTVESSDQLIALALACEQAGGVYRAAAAQMPAR